MRFTARWCGSSDVTAMRVKGLHGEAHACHAVVVLETVSRDRTLAFTVPKAEATRLAAALGVAPGCSPICDLVLRLTQRLGASVVRAVIDADEERIAASLVLERGDDMLALACHPADAVTLALRAEAPIDATDDALRHAHPVPGAPDDQLTRWLRRVTPEDFST